MGSRASAFLFAVGISFSLVVLSFRLGANPAADCLELEKTVKIGQFKRELPSLDLPTTHVYNAYETTRKKYPEFQAKFPREIVYELLVNPDALYLVQRLGALLNALAEKSPEGYSDDEMQERLGALLRNNVPAEQIPERLAGLDQPNFQTVQRALGYNSTQDFSLLLLGPDRVNPSPESLIGQFTAFTGLRAFERKFGTKPKADGSLNEASAKGPSRLVVPVTESSIPEWLRLFARPELMIHAHGKRQGHLYVGHNGQVGAMMQIPRVGSNIRFALGAIWPTIVLSTGEGGRARTYFDLSYTTPYAKTPWQLEGFCATGAYISCTHWMGEMGIGDTLVDTWEFPGRIDQFANQREPNITGDPKAPRIQKLHKWQLPQGHSLPDETVHKLEHLFTFPRAHQQLAHMLGTRDQLIGGEWANPGYVAITLLGHAVQERVPVVFYNVSDQTSRVPRDFDTAIHAK